jgi:uncharacterized alkaline shock family protein YloU
VTGAGDAGGHPQVTVPAAERGSLRIADRVVAKIAARAAHDALADAPRAEHVPAGTRPNASVAVRRGKAYVRLSVELGYPNDIGAVARSVRRRVADRVQALTGMDVPEVAVEVERLHSPATHPEDEWRVR